MHINVNDGRSVESITAHPGDTLLSVLRQAGYSVTAPCGGQGTCGKCATLLEDGTSRSHLALACQTAAQDNMTVHLDHTAPILVEDSFIGASSRHDDFNPKPQGSLGVAVDVGTTTVACYLYDLHTGKPLARAGTANPQAVFGADVISRIAACRDGALSAMQRSIVECIQNMVGNLRRSAGRCDGSIVQWCLVGNTVMQHILCGLSPESIGTAPFTPVSLFGGEHTVPGLGEATYLGPCVSGYVGADIAAGLIACNADRTTGCMLFADLGTNGELALSVDGNVSCCATATGPAFEGANISMGMQARPGAITACAIGNKGFELTTIGNSPATGICGAGLISVLACCLDIGLIDETGRIATPKEMPPAFRPLLRERDGVVAIILTPDGSVSLTQADVRALQLAKAAVCAGLLTLLANAGTQLTDVDELVIGGAFGTHLDSAAAARVGIFPAALLPRTRMVGNCAGAGVCDALLSASTRSRMEAIAQSAKYHELSTNAIFSDAYIEAMMFDEA